MEKKLEIGLLVDDLNLSELNQEIIHHIIDQKICNKFTIIKQNIPKKNFIFFRKKYSIFRIAEKSLIKLVFLFEKYFLSRFFKRKYNFKKIDIQLLTKDILNVYPHISKSGYFFEYSEEDIEIIKNKKLDIIVRLGSGIIRGKMLKASKNGIFSFHHGDNQYFRGGPPGFWEVYYNKSLTGFVIQRLNEVLDGGEILFKGHVETKYNYYLNQQSIFKNSAKYLTKILLDLKLNRLKNIKIDASDAKIFKDPKFSVILKYVAKTYFKLIKKFIFEIILNKKIRWHVSFKSNTGIENLKLSDFEVIQNQDKNRFLADPFVIEKNNKNFIFLEDFYFSKIK